MRSRGLVGKTMVTLPACSFLSSRMPGAQTHLLRISDEGEDSSHEAFPNFPAEQSCQKFDDHGLGVAGRGAEDNGTSGRVCGRMAGCRSGLTADCHLQLESALPRSLLNRLARDTYVRTERRHLLGIWARRISLHS